jgi:hypothetical protein
VNPEPLLVNQLLTIFPREQIAPAGLTVYHSPVGEDPIVPYCLYRRTSSHFERDLDGVAHGIVVDFDVSVDSMFFDNVANSGMPDNWIDSSTGSNWFFTLEGVEADQIDFRVIYSYSASTAM